MGYFSAGLLQIALCLELCCLFAKRPCRRTPTKANGQGNQNKKRKERNRQKRSALSTAIKAVRAAVASKDVKTAKVALDKAVSLIDRASQKKLIHRNNASRKISRLTTHVSSLTN